MFMVHIRHAIRRMLPSWYKDKWVAARHRLDFKMKTRRESPTDYIVEFEHRNIKKARKSILWFDNWDTATLATIQIFKELGVVRDGQTIIDYGCGIGRIAKALTDSFRVKVFAVDRALEMRRHAGTYIPAQRLQNGSVEILSDQELLDRLPAIGGGGPAPLHRGFSAHTRTCARQPHTGTPACVGS